MAPRRERPGHILRSGLPGDFAYLMLWNEVANLAQDVELGSCWFDFVFFHPCLVAGSTGQANTFSFFYGMAVKWFLGTYSARFNRRHQLLGHVFVTTQVHFALDSEKAAL
jgi:hypothetical protein